MTFQLATVTTLKKADQEMHYWDKISNMLQIHLDGADYAVPVVIPSDWIYFLHLAGIKPEDGEVLFYLEDGETPNTVDLCYSQGDGAPIHINTVTASAVRQHAWLFT